MPTWYLTVLVQSAPWPAPQPRPPLAPPPLPLPKAPSLTGWGHSAAEVRSLFEGRIINPTM